MRANITINDAGIILAASNAPPPIGGAAVSRVNQKMSITLGAKPTVSELENIIATLSQSALSQHLGRLRRANIVRTRRDSQTIYYSIDDHDVLRILRLLPHIYEDDSVIRRTRH
jgi:DNA-binding transcriptional ArsR family regulator